jgi:hypothetical protein
VCSMQAVKTECPWVTLSCNGSAAAGEVHKRSPHQGTLMVLGSQRRPHSQPGSPRILPHLAIMAEKSGSERNRVL